MRDLLFWVVVTGIIGAVTAIQFEREYGVALGRVAEAQVKTSGISSSHLTSATSPANGRRNRTSVGHPKVLEATAQ